MAITGNESFLTQAIETGTLPNSCIFVAASDSGMQLNHSSNQVAIVFTGNVSALNTLKTQGVCVLTNPGVMITRAFDSSVTIDWSVNGGGNFVANVAPATSNQLIQLALNGVNVAGGIWPTINLIPGSGTTINAVSNAFTGSYDVSISFDAGTALTNPMTTTGDMIRGGTGGVPVRLPGGTNGQFMQMITGEPAWAGLPAEVSFATSVTIGDVVQSTYGLYVAGNSQIAMGNSIIPATPIANIGILWVNTSGILNYSNNTSNYAVAFGNGAVGSIPIGISGGYGDLTIGANGTVLTSNGTTAHWVAGGGGSTVYSGQATLSGGTVTISNANVTSGSFPIMSYVGPSNPGILFVSAIVNGVSFTITSTNSSDASTINWSFSV